MARRCWLVVVVCFFALTVTSVGEAATLRTTEVLPGGQESDHGTIPSYLEVHSSTKDRFTAVVVDARAVLTYHNVLHVVEVTPEVTGPYVFHDGGSWPVSDPDGPAANVQFEAPGLDLVSDSAARAVLLYEGTVDFSTGRNKLTTIEGWVDQVTYSLSATRRTDEAWGEPIQLDAGEAIYRGSDEGGGVYTAAPASNQYLGDGFSLDPGLANPSSVSLEDDKSAPAYAPEPGTGALLGLALTALAARRNRSR